MSVQDKISKKFRGIQGGLFEKVSKADVGTALNDLIANGAALMCWADPFYPDPAIPEHVKRATLAGLEDGTSAHYTMPIGNMELKMELAKKLKAFNHLDVDPERNIIITPGSDAGLMFAMMPFIDPGDEVMVPDPSYPNNFLNARILGGVTVPVPLREENGYQLEIEEFEKRLTPNTKMIVLTNPNNPTTTVMRRESLEKLAQFAVKNDLIVVCDQAFEDSVYDGGGVCHPCVPARHVGTHRHGMLHLQGNGAQRLPGGLHRGGRPHHGCVLWQRRKRDRSHQHRLSTGSHCCVEGCLFPGGVQPHL